ncbi:MAG: hypothetical protein VW397_03395, partial [Candidatus Margulisiibacteriota bacterium]
MKFLAILFMVFYSFSNSVYAVPGFSAITLEQSGRIIRGTATKAFYVTVTSDATELLTSLTLTATSGTPFNSAGSNIVNVKLYSDTDGDGAY